MNFSIVKIMRRLFAPQHELSCSRRLWKLLVSALRQRGYNGQRESGAFLLGHREGSRARITDFVLYDDLDPKCLETGIVRFDGRYFGTLWDICRQQRVSVVADVHTHPAGSQQSDSDRANPMISRPGHVALILPRFAAAPVRRGEVGMYRYDGSKQWSPVPAKKRMEYFHLGF
jgi:proteasome lid subunit RPN8/RPN11